MITKQENELQNLRSESERLSSELMLREELSSGLEVQVANLERKVHAAEEAAQSAAQKLSVALEERTNLADQVREQNSAMANIRVTILKYVRY